MLHVLSELSWKSFLGLDVRGPFGLILAQKLYFILILIAQLSRKLFYLFFPLFCGKLKYPCVNRWQHSSTNWSIMFNTWKMHALLNELRHWAAAVGTQAHTRTERHVYVFTFILIVLVVDWLSFENNWSLQMKTKQNKIRVWKKCRAAHTAEAATALAAASTTDILTDFPFSQISARQYMYISSSIFFWFARSLFNVTLLDHLDEKW